MKLSREGPDLNFNKIVAKSLSAKYCSLDKNLDTHSENLIDALVFNKNCHYSSLFKDRLLWDYIDEFMKRYYHSIEAYDRVPKMARYYTNYLTFFCKPLFRDYYANYILKRYGDNRAELYYKIHYGKKEKSHKSLVKSNINLSTNSELNLHEYDVAKVLLTTIIREKINQNSMTDFDIKLNSELKSHFDISPDLTQLNFYELEESMKSGLITKRSQKEESLQNILFQIDPLNMDEMFLVNYKKNLFNGRNISTVDRTTKDYSSKTNKEHFDINKIEIKEKIETVRGTNIIADKNNFRDKQYSETIFDREKIRNDYIGDFASPNKERTLTHTETKNDLIIIPNVNNTKTRNKLSILHKGNEFKPAFSSAFCNSNTYNKQMNAEILKNFSPENTNKYLEKIQTETLKALNKIKKGKLEFRNVQINDVQKENKVVYNDCNDLRSNSKPNNDNKNLLMLNDLLKTSLNDKNSRNKQKNEAKTEFKQNNIHNPLIKSINFNEENSARKKRTEEKISLKEIPQNNNKLKIDSSSSNNSRFNSKSPNKKEKPSQLNITPVTPVILNYNALQEIIDKTKTMSRNKATNLLGPQTNTNLLKTLSKNKNNSKEKEGNEYKSFKSFKSFKKEKSVITQTVVNINLPSSKVEDLEKRIYGTFASNYNIMKQIINKNIKDKENDKNVNTKENLNKKKSIEKIGIVNNNFNIGKTFASNTINRPVNLVKSQNIKSITKKEIIKKTTTVKIQSTAADHKINNKKQTTTLLTNASSEHLLKKKPNNNTILSTQAKATKRVLK